MGSGRMTCAQDTTIAAIVSAGMCDVRFFGVQSANFALEACEFPR